MKQEELGKKLVNYTLGIGQKENTDGITKAEKKYGKKIRALLKQKRVKASKQNQKMLDDLCKLDYGPLFIKEKDYYRPKPMIGHSVMITYNAANKKVAMAAKREAMKKGAHVIAIERSTQEIRESYNLKPIDSLRELSPINKALHSTVDYYINIEAIENEFWKNGITKDKLRVSAAPSMKLHEIRDKRLQRWCLVGWPHPQIAKELGIPPAKFKRIVEGALEESFNPRTKKLVEAYYQALNGSNEIRILHDDGTDLSFSVKGRRFLKDDGVLDEDDIANKDVGMNLPCGETFTAPVENSANGLLKIPKNIIPGYGLAEDIELFFEKGVVVDYGARKHRDYLTKFFEENTGECRRIAEFGIGCNAKAEFTNGYIIVDEKIKGTIHVAIGWNIGYGGKNNASSHLDFIKPMYHGQVYADGVLVMDRGRLA